MDRYSIALNKPVSKAVPDVIRIKLNPRAFQDDLEFSIKKMRPKDGDLIFIALPDVRSIYLPVVIKTCLELY